MQVVESEETVPSGHVVLSASFEKESDGMPTEGTLTLHIRDKAVGSGDDPERSQGSSGSVAGVGLRALGARGRHRRLSQAKAVVVHGGTSSGHHRRQRRRIHRSRQGRGRLRAASP